jgi:hypothetical protein
VSDIAPVLASRSVVAIADTELLRVARVDTAVPDAAATRPLSARIRGRSLLSTLRGRPKGRPGPVARSRG